MDVYSIIMEYIYVSVKELTVYSTIDEQTYIVKSSTTKVWQDVYSKMHTVTLTKVEVLVTRYLIVHCHERTIKSTHCQTKDVSILKLLTYTQYFLIILEDVVYFIVEFNCCSVYCVIQAVVVDSKLTSCRNTKYWVAICIINPAITSTKHEFTPC